MSATGTAYVDATELAFWTNEFSFDPTCPSGNCTWPTFYSTELCSRCEDVTSHSTLVGCDPGSFNASLSEDMQISCNVSLPQGAWSSDPICISRTFQNGRSARHNLGCEPCELKGQQRKLFWHRKSIVGGCTRCPDCSRFLGWLHMGSY
jgi:hypothetical protein